MNSINVIMVRIFLDADDTKINTLMKRLHDWEKVRGVTVTEALTGFGRSGLPKPSPDLPVPLVVEFFDTPEKIDPILEDISSFIASEHIVTWNANLIVGSNGIA